MGYLSISSVTVVSFLQIVMFESFIHHFPYFSTNEQIVCALQYGTMILNSICVIWIFINIYIMVINSWSITNLLMAGTHASLTHAESVSIGIQRGLNECSRQFSFERWSCPENLFSDTFQQNLPANKEIAFLQAIISAGIVYTVTRNCSLGQLNNCSCDLTKRNKRESIKSGFRWGGCSDNTHLGSIIAATYLDSRRTGRDFKAIVKQHNNEVGRNAVKETMAKICKCHGVSGTCTVKTCFRRINDFQEVGNYLKNAYRTAIKVIFDNKMKPMREKEVVNASSDIPKTKLIYSEDSPDYCTANATLGSNGTLGRYCSQRTGRNATTEDHMRCRKLCKECGLRVKKEIRIIEKSCNCKFKFCCQVQCETCAEKHRYLVCAPKRHSIDTIL